MWALIVDDSRATRAILRRILAELGFTALEAGDGGEAARVLAEVEHPVALALVDWNMPEVDGLTFVKEVRADHAHDRMQIVMVTTESETVRVIEALEAGANEYVMKPFTAGALREKLELLGLAVGS